MEKILITRRLPDPVLDAARARFDVTLRDDTTPMSAAELADAMAQYDGILPTLGDQLTADAFVGDLKCRVLANFGVGYNHIDVTAARGAGVAVSNTPGAVTDATADIAMTLMLMTCRRAGEGERLVRAGQWAGWHPTQLLGQHVSGKTVGIVGLGRIGKAIARRCHFGFGMDVVFYNRSQVADPGVPAQQLNSLTDVANACDVLIVALPATPETHHMINVSVFAAMRPTAVFVNIARGDIVDETALIDALQSGQIAGAGLDVYEFEPKVPQALRALENVTLFPHLGTATLEVRTAMGMMAVDNLVAFFDGRDLPNPV
ncbi:2-hydroxyacid dehydrogenase [Oceaniglobus ichthyenteri]|uniref:2-hydroxyacid dehydrogenase n=1 Tax=Oceaniglobus ichthyenteri TaxID=2136177 RepID=UPI000D3798C8|nr:D-glycerate dehydrogenase [Oceaniglobus ichthyenteri]